MAEVQSNYKEELINRIMLINDKEVIDEIYRLLEVGLDDSVHYLTSDEQKLEIGTAQQQIATGAGIPSEQADRDIDQWFLK